MKKGFTLIELLIVIAIIGILASALLVSLGGARAAARDARRIGDLRQVQAALELYFNKCGNYPGDATCGVLSNPTDWATLTSVLTGAGISISKIPNDPSSSQTYAYGVGSGNQSYVLAATLETANQALSNDIDGTVNGINCTGPTAVDVVYCVSN